MEVVSFLHQKGGTGKSTLAVGAAAALAARGEAVLLMDADYQGTAQEWGNRFGTRLGVETRSQVQPILHEEVARYRNAVRWLIVDGPPSLSPMTESILRASDRVVIPVRPARPDLWALPWLVAVIKKLRGKGEKPAAKLVFNMVNDEALEPLRQEIAPLGLPVHPTPLPSHPAFKALFEGQPLPADLAAQVLALLSP
ncbi:MAG: ParA family protein [bacterium]